MAVLEYTSRYRWVILTLAFAGQFGNSLAFQSIAPLAPLFQPELGLTKAEVGLFTSILFAGQWFMLLAAGTLTDRFGVRTVMGVCELMVGLSMISMAWVGNYAQALSVMFVAGVVSAGILPGVTKAIVDWFPFSIRGTVMGFKQAAVPVGGVLTAVLLPSVGLAFGWRFAVASVGIVGIAGGIATLTWYRTGTRKTFPSGKRTSMKDGLRAVLRNARLWRLSLVSILYVTVQLALTSYLALFLKETVLVPVLPDESARIVAAGGYLAICQFGGALGRVFWGALSDRFFGGRRMIVLAICGAVTVIGALGTSLMGVGFPLWLVPPIVFAFGASAVGWNGLYHVAMAETAGQRFAATGVGLSMTLNQLGTFGGPPLFGYIVDTTYSYQFAWLIMAAFAAVGTVMALLNSRGEGAGATAS